MGSCVLFVSGLLGGLSATENDLKELLSITQEQGERKIGLFMLVLIYLKKG